ncbi:MAG: DNA polymerase Y family protein, partial [Acidovorax sp.]|uniref:DNA polymerase Y family protein n=1 Tax=Acidovorax sp. TaxID=1872122 RepID=UPI0039E55FC3
ATALAALALLRLALAGHAPPRRGLRDLPLHTLTALRPHAASLERMGCRTWGSLRALPRSGVARRFGAEVLHALDQALGDAPEAHTWVELPEQFALSADLPALAESADALLWSASRCLTALQHWLQARQQGALVLDLCWRHDLRRVDGVDIAPTQSLPLRTAQATQDMAHLRRLLSENLARTTLAAPVHQITLRLVESTPLAQRSASLLPLDDSADSGGEALHQLLERLSARLGPAQVQAPVLHADHRPECMQQWRPAAEALGQGGNVPAPDAAPDAELLPPWLLRPPRPLAVQGSRPCHHGPLRLLAGPQRFEAGWWADEAAAMAQRDYFVAHNDAAGLVWVFRERQPPAPGQPHRWFLHGVFA